VLVEDNDYRYFESMWDFMDSGVDGEIVEVNDYPWDDELPYPDYHHIGKLLIVIKGLAIKQDVEGTKKIGDYHERIKGIVERREILKNKRINAILEARRRSRYIRTLKFLLFCNTNRNLRMKSWFCRALWYSYITGDKLIDKRSVECSLLLAIFLELF